MAYNQQHNTAENYTVNESDANYEKAALDLLRNSLKLSYTERFHLFTRLYKIQKTLSRAKITHQPFIEKP